MKMDDSSQIVLFANFDSGNMSKYERVSKTSSSSSLNTNASLAASLLAPSQNNNWSTSVSNAQNQIEMNNASQSTTTNNYNSSNISSTKDQKFDVEFNVWTRPDCADTSIGPNANRTWFYFGLKGGHGKYIKFNIMNLNRQGRLFEMGMLPVFRTVPGHENWSRIYTRPTWQLNAEQQNFQVSFIHRIPDRKDTVTYFAFCFPHSYEECQIMLENYDREFSYCKNLTSEKCFNDPDLIYYHRELLCHSLDKRRIDLITVSSCNQINLKREPRFDPQNLFPKTDESNLANRRCYRFDNKRVFILTSRVHPGETPASFVFNGFLQFILRRDDPRARALRRNFVFKLVPMLNPDGVARGYYRTDQLGVNLNRVYLDPSFKLHPSIYAIKSLIVFHHIFNRTSKEHDGIKFDHIFKLDYENKEDEFVTSSLESNLLFTTINNETATDEPTQNQNRKSSVLSQSSTSKSSPLFNLSPSKSPEINNKLLINSTDFHFLKKDKKPSIKSLETNEIFTENSTNLNGSKSFCNENSDEEDFNEIETLLNNENTNNSPHLNDAALLMINPLWSGIAFYMDLHGHAGRRGCFIYGNSIENELYQIENVLFAKLISFNTQHFDFEGCNFSIKNMYMKDKREGLSKEGSGRVAMFKNLGIIHSYTLECCYASGKSMNQIAPAANTSFLSYLTKDAQNASTGTSLRCISPPLHSDIPPKFMPEHYMDVGKAVAIAALDIIELNQFSRVPNTSFGNLEAVRNWIKFYIKPKNSSKDNTNNAHVNSSSSTISTQASSTNNTSKMRKNSLQKSVVKANTSSSSLTNSKTINDRAKLNASKAEIRNSIKQLKELETPQSKTSTSNSISSFNSSKKLAQNQSLLNARKSTQNKLIDLTKYNKTNRMANRKLMPITKASVLTHSIIVENNDESALKDVKKTLTTGKKPFLNSQNRLNMLNIVINSKSFHERADNHNESNQQPKQHKSNFELETQTKEEEESNQEESDNRAKTVDDLALLNGNMKPNKKAFFSLDFERASVKLVRRTKSVFFT